MKNETTSSFDEYSKLVGQFGTGIYRGLSDAAFALIPKIGRTQWLPNPEVPNDAATHTLLKTELWVMDSFKTYARPFVESALLQNKWELLALMQHHGAPTRLMDWTFNPLVALYFACVEQDHSDKDGVVYYFQTAHTADIEKLLDPFDISRILLYTPTHFTQRVSAQASCFTVHPDPSVPFNSEYLVHPTEVIQIIIPATQKKQMLKRLRKLEIHNRSLFPGLDGIGEYLCERLMEGR